MADASHRPRRLVGADAPTRPSPAAEAAARSILEMAPADRLRLAARLVEQRRYSLAQTVVKSVTIELSFALLEASVEGGS